MVLERFQVEFAADSLRLDVLELARAGNKLLSVAGRPEWMCQAVEVADPVTFTTADTFLVSCLFCFVASAFFAVRWANKVEQRGGNAHWRPNGALECHSIRPRRLR